MNKTLYEILKANPALRESYNQAFEAEMRIVCEDVRFPEDEVPDVFYSYLTKAILFETEYSLGLEIEEFESLGTSKMHELPMPAMSMAIEVIKRRSSKDIIPIGSPGTWTMGYDEVSKWISIRKMIVTMQRKWHEIMNPYILKAESSLLTRYNLTKSFTGKTLTL